MKRSYDEKIEMCLKHENGCSCADISRMYHIDKSEFCYMYALYTRYGPEVLKHSFNHWPSGIKQEAVNRVINGESIRSVALNMRLSTKKTLKRWLKEYKENGYTIVERKRGKPPMNKSSTKKKESLTLKERIKQLEQENLELKAENEYLKKLDALVQKRKAQQLKNKS